MTTKQNFYNYLKSYKSKQCKKDEACGAISKMKKAELQKLAYALGYTIDNRVYKGKKTEAKQSTPTPVTATEPAAKGTLKSSIETLENKIKKIKKEINEDQNKIDDPNVKPSMKLLTKLKTKKMKWLKLLKELKSMKKKK
jgi:hypothetical protein